MRLAAAAMMKHPHSSQPPPDWQLLSEGLRRYALALTGRTQDAEELAQQTLSHLLARAPEKASHVGYARRTMTRLWLDEQRSIRRRLRRYALLARRAIESSPAGASMTDAELSSILSRRIETLPPQQRAVLVLRLIEEMDHEHIAEALGTSVAAVRANLHLARRAVARSMGDLS
jgi:RNA polymerase sigma factor (sigma-70 family)